MGEENKTSKLIFKSYIARRLIKMGNKVIDIKPDRENAQRTIFVFQIDDKFNRDFDTVINELADERINNKTAKTVKETKE